MIAAIANCSYGQRMVRKHAIHLRMTLALAGLCLAIVMSCATSAEARTELRLLPVDGGVLSSAIEPVTALRVVRTGQAEQSANEQTAKKGRCNSDRPPLNLPTHCKRATLTAITLVLSSRSPVRHKPVDALATPEHSVATVLAGTGPPGEARGSPSPFWAVFSTTMRMLN